MKFIAGVCVILRIIYGAVLPPFAHVVFVLLHGLRLSSVRPAGAPPRPAPPRPARRALAVIATACSKIGRYETMKRRLLKLEMERRLEEKQNRSMKAAQEAQSASAGARLARAGFRRFGRRASIMHVAGSMDVSCLFLRAAEARDEVCCFYSVVCALWHPCLVTARSPM